MISSKMVCFDTLYMIQLLVGIATLILVQISHSVGNIWWTLLHGVM